VDRCALFVDAGYVLSDGALAVHGTRHRDSVSWDYAGLLKLLASLSRDRTGLPVLRCYWYEATVDSRRTSEHDALADLPGLKLRLGKMRPGRREGVEAEIHRDLTALARNGAVSDAIIVSAEEDLAPVVAEVQDFGIRVVIVHIAVDGDWTISRPLRQECDDIIEITGAHLRPFVDLITGAEPARSDEQYASRAYQSTDLAEGHARAVSAMTHRGLPAAALPAPTPIYAAPLAGEYQRVSQLPGVAMAGSAAGQGTSQGGSESARPAGAQGPDTTRSSQEMPGSAGSRGQVSGRPQARVEEMARPNDQQGYPSAEQLRGSIPVQPQNGLHQSGLHQGGLPPSGPQQGAPQQGSQQQLPAQQGSLQQGGPQQGALRQSGPQQGPAQQGSPPSGLQQGGLQQGGLQEGGLPQTGPPQSGAPQSGLPQSGLHQGGLHQGGLPPGGLPPNAASQNGLQQNGLPQNSMQQNGLPPNGPPQGGLAGPESMRPSGPHRQPAGGSPGQSAGGSPGQPGGGGSPGQPAGGGSPGHYLQGPVGPYGAPDQASRSQFPGAHQGQHGASGPVPGFHPAAQGPYSGPQPAAGQPPALAPVSVSLADAVQAAHVEGFGFGEAVARDAPALWLEAVLARKPRMPSDLEARLLQGSALPIDSLLHDEVRHALRRGFWDALERSRR
jgi:NYN domain